MQTILLVEDENLLLDGLEKMLIEYFPDVEVTTAANGYEGIEKLKAQQVSLVITNLMMPRVDGFELISFVNNHFPDMPIVVISGMLNNNRGRKSKKTTEERLRKLNVNCWLGKPFQVEETIKFVEIITNKLSGKN